MKLHHIGIAVKDLGSALKIWQETLGLRLIEEVAVSDQQVIVALLELDEVHIELVQPSSAASTVHKFIEKKGEGLHHLCFEVDDIEKFLCAMKKNGIRLIDEVPRKGALGFKVAFVHPKDMGGVLIELCEKDKK